MRVFLIAFGLLSWYTIYIDRGGLPKKRENENNVSAFILLFPPPFANFIISVLVEKYKPESAYQYANLGCNFLWFGGILCIEIRKGGKEMDFMDIILYIFIVLLVLLFLVFVIFTLLPLWFIDTPVVLTF